MDNDIAKILISSDEIQAKVREIGERIARDYTPLGDLLLVGVLKGCMMFMVDLARAIPMPLAIDFIATSSYGHSTESSGVVRLLKDLDTDIAGRHVLIVEDIIDSGLTLAYHNHDAEMRKSAREFHHMMLGTDAKNVSLCLDSHWVFRGSGDSQVCLFDIVKLYADRVVELHLRQSQRGVWTEAFGPGDIDYARLVKMLLERKVRPHVVLEQAVEAKSAKTLGPVEAHAKGVAYTAKVFADLAG